MVISTKKRIKSNQLVLRSDIMPELLQDTLFNLYNGSFNDSDNLTNFASIEFQQVGHWEALLLLPAVLSGITG